LLIEIKSPDAIVWRYWTDRYWKSVPSIAFCKAKTSSITAFTELAVAISADRAMYLKLNRLTVRAAETHVLPCEIIARWQNSRDLFLYLTVSSASCRGRE